MSDNACLVCILWGEGGRPKGPHTTPHHSRPYGRFTRKEGGRPKGPRTTPCHTRPYGRFTQKDGESVCLQTPVQA